MSVSKQYITASAVLALLTAAPAFAGGMGGTGDGCCTSGAFTGGITNIPVVSGTNNGCCGTVSNQVIGVPGVTVPGSNLGVNMGGNNIGGVNYNLGGSTFGGTNVNVGGNTFIGGNSSGGVYYGGSSGSYYGGGGGFYAMPSATTPGMIELNVGGQSQAVMETVNEQKTTTEIVPLRAVCMDDRGTPHPASRPTADEKVAAEFDGEVYRCMAGTHMEVTVGKMVNGVAVFDGGTALSCTKGQALSYKGGNLVCTAQIAQRNCNERSLLRRFGPGIKYVTLMRTQTVQTQRQAQTSQATAFRSSMFVDGGVGQGVY